jgi:hypothetical protein
MSNKRERGRSANQMTPAQQMTDRSQKETDFSNPENRIDRPRRIPMGRMQRMSVPEYLLDRERFHYAMMVDRPGNLESAEAAYYEYVLDDSGSKISRNSGQGETSYLMRLPIEYYKEDQLAKRRQNNATVRKEAELEKDQYVPGGATSAISES